MNAVAWIAAGIIAGVILGVIVALWAIRRASEDVIGRRLW